MASRKRRPNWTDDECLLLAKLLQERKDVIRGKCSTGVKQQAKKQAWEEITTTINSAFPETQRTVSDCNKKWENLLAKAKEEIKRQKRDTSNAEAPTLEQFSPLTQTVLSVMNLTDMLQQGTWTTKSDCGSTVDESVTNKHPLADHGLPIGPSFSQAEQKITSNNVAKSLTMLLSSPHPAAFADSGEHLDATSSTSQQSAHCRTLQERMDLEMSVLRRQDAVLKLQEEYYTLKIKKMKRQMEELLEKD